MIAARLVLAALAGLCCDLCALLLTAASAWLITRAAQQPPIASLGLAIVGVRGFALGRGTFRYLERVAGHDVALRAVAVLRGRVFDRLAVRRAAVREPAEVNRMVGDVDAVQDLLLRCLLPVVAAVGAAVAGLLVCAFVLPGTAPVLGAALAATVLLAAVLATCARGRANAVDTARDTLAARALELTEGAAELAVFGAADRAVAAAERAAAELGRCTRRADRLGVVAEAAGFLVQLAGAGGVALLALASGADQVVVAVVTLSALTTVQLCFPLIAATRHLLAALPAARRLRCLLREPGTAAGSRPGGAGLLELRGVRVGDDPVPALSTIDLTVRPGQRIAVVGTSGAGKSTLLGVLAGVVTPGRGSVLLDGAPPGEYAGGAVRGLFQDAHVFTASVRANLLMARPDAAESELVRAARGARFLEVVDELPDGWDTVVGDGGRGLSGGQRQRLLLARALLADPPILLLDEPTENLDTATADAIVTELLTSTHPRTLILVTHRLSPLRHADDILVLNEGRVRQRGTHTALLAHDGFYRDLWHTEQTNATPHPTCPA